MSQYGIGTVLAGRYRLLEQLKAGTRDVWRAVDTTLGEGRTVVVKTFSLPEDYEHEYRVQKDLGEHPSIVTLLDARDGEHPFLVYEHIPSGELSALRGKDVSESLVQRIVQNVLKGLIHAHERGVLHLDLKLENVLLRNSHGDIAIIDFGAAKRVDPVARSTIMSTGDRTPATAAPELLVAGERPDDRTDSFSVGILLAELYRQTPLHVNTGMLLYAGADDEKEAHLQSLEQPLPEALRPVLRQLLSEKQGDRPSALQTLRLLEQVCPKPKGEEPPPTHRLYLDRQLYVPVHADGSCGTQEGKWCEGVLGVVLEAKLTRGGGSLALKVPRLLADTHRENANICRLLRDERDVLLNFQGGSRAGLPIVETAYDGVSGIVGFRGRTPEGAEDQQGQVICVCFAKGSPPRMVGVVDGPDGAPRTHPPKVSIPIRTNEELKRIREIISRGEPGDHVVVLEANRHHEEAGREVRTLESFLDPGSVLEETWYVGLPSLVLHWGSINLQEALESNSIPGHYPKDLELVEQVLVGLTSIHERGIVHGDLRPANVMCSGDPTRCENYFVIDFGSLQVLSRGDGTKPDEVAALGGGRRSPFYAPERQGGVERESADVAVIVPIEVPNQGLRVLLGWQRTLLSGNTVPPGLIDEIRAATFEESQTAIRPHDRIQVRDYLFEVRAVGFLPGRNGMLLQCSPHYWRVLHESVVVREVASPPPFLLTPRVIHFPQWSGASDIYSVGALLLYLLTRRGTATAFDRENLDARFAQMLAALGSESFYARIWPNLCTVVAHVVKHRSHRRPENVTLKLAFQAEGRPQEDENQTTFVEHSRWVAGLIQHAARDTIHVLRAVNHNSAVFILVMHFVLRCLHRRDVLPATSREFIARLAQAVPQDDEELETIERLFYPFAERRDALPSAALAGQVRNSLRRLQGVLSHLDAQREGWQKFVIGTEAADDTPDMVLRMYVKDLKEVALQAQHGIKSAIEAEQGRKLLRNQQLLDNLKVCERRMEEVLASVFGKTMR